MLAGPHRCPPQRFFDALEQQGWRVAERMIFPDHHWFTAADLERVDVAARTARAVAVLTTEKDAARLPDAAAFRVKWVAVPLQVSVEPAAEFAEWLCARVSAARAADGRRHLMGASMKARRFAVETALVKTLSAAIARCRWPARRCGRGLGRMIHAADAFPATSRGRNLARAFPSRTAAERRASRATCSRTSARCCCSC